MLVINRGLQSVSIRLEPNRSANWRQTRSVILGLTGFMLMIGVGWLAMGVWLIFPFVLLDIAIFSYFFYRVCESTYAAEIITVDKDSVKFRSGPKQARFFAYWVSYWRSRGLPLPAAASMCSTCTRVCGSDDRSLAGAR